MRIEKAFILWSFLLVVAAIAGAGCRNSVLFKPVALAQIGTINAGAPLIPYMESTNEVLLPVVACPILPVNEVPFTIKSIKVEYYTMAGVRVNNLEFNTFMHLLFDPEEGETNVNVGLYTRDVYEYIIGPVEAVGFDAFGFPNFFLTDDKPLNANIILMGDDIHGNDVTLKASVYLTADVVKGKNPYGS